MKRFDDYPKSFKKMVRFIRQEATLEQIRGMQHIFGSTVAWRLEMLQRTPRDNEPQTASGRRGK
ncbi:hypothetical protein [Paenibacillus sp. GYB003]|uniref:hypothetical protein n=1 Tax=Paenibacillus sp. GYB003 TaxID=2994392 RepID=UPI002F96969E